MTSLLLLAAAITLSWEAPVPTGYQVQYGTEPGKPTTTIDVGNTLSWSGDLPPGTYYFSVHAYDSTHGAPPTEIMHVVKPSPTPTPTPTPVPTPTPIPSPSATPVATPTPATALSLWPDSSTPTRADGGNDNQVELGLKFRSDIPGKVLGVKFYKSSANTGQHVANLWSPSGQKLASATFSGESASGWQKVLFAQPVSIAAGQTYVVSYNCRAGHYAADENYFTNRSVDTATLHAPSSGNAGGQGVYRYGSAPAFPNQTYRNTNYWVDVIFSP